MLNLSFEGRVFGALSGLEALLSFVQLTIKVLVGLLFESQFVLHLLIVVLLMLFEV